MKDSTTEKRAYSDALDVAEHMLGFRLERFLIATEGEPENAADFKRLATVHAFGDAWPRTEHLDARSRALVSVTIESLCEAAAHGNYVDTATVAQSESSK